MEYVIAGLVVLLVGVIYLFGKFMHDSRWRV